MSQHTYNYMGISYVTSVGYIAGINHEARGVGYIAGINHEARGPSDLFLKLTEPLK